MRHSTRDAGARVRTGLSAPRRSACAPGRSTALGPRALFASPTKPGEAAMTDTLTPEAPTAAPAPLRSVHTSNFPELLRRLGISVLVSTYQAGRLVLLRPDGDVLNTHFRSFAKPMGLAVAGDRLAV